MLISVIVTAYNIENYIGKCLNSIINQTYSNLEIIVVDDGSSDSTSKICDYYSSKDSRIRVIHKKNGGAADARNAALEICSGDFIGFVDGDDFIEKDMYESLVNACTLYKADIAICGRNMVYDDPNMKSKNLFTLDKCTEFSVEEVIESILIGINCDTAPWDKLYRRKCFENERFPKGVAYDDICTIPKVISHSNKIVHIGMPKYNYLQRNDGVCRKPFNENSYSMVEEAYKLQEFIKNSYPSLDKQAMHFKNYYIVSFIRKVGHSDKVSYSDKKRILQISKHEFINIILDNNISIHDRLGYLKNNLFLVAK